MKRLLCAFLCLVFVFSLTLTAAASGDPVTLRWLMQVGSEEEAKQWKELADDVTTAFPNIKVDLATTDWNGYWAKLPTEIAGGNSPDILYMQVMRAKSFLKDGFYPIDEFIAADTNVNMDDFYQGVVDGLSEEGKVYCLPYDFGPYITFFNMDLFEKHGVAYPDDNMDYATYAKICEDLSKDGDYGAALSANIDRSNSYIWGEGVKYFTDDGKFVVNDPKAAFALQRQADLIKNGFAPQQTDTGNFNWDREQFYSGTVGMMLDGPWNMTNIKTKGNFKIGVTLVPSGSAGRVSPIAGSGFGVSKDSKHKQEAYYAVTSLTSKESLTKLATWGRALPSRASVREVYYEKHADVPGLKDAVERSCDPSIGVPYLTTTNWQEVYNAINANIEPVFMGDLDAQSGLDAAQAMIDGILGQ